MSTLSEPVWLEDRALAPGDKVRRHGTAGTWTVTGVEVLVHLDQDGTALAAAIDDIERYDDVSITIEVPAWLLDEIPPAVPVASHLCVDEVAAVNTVLFAVREARQ